MGPTTYLYVPGNKLDFVEKAFNKGAENIFIDLDDFENIKNFILKNKIDLEFEVLNYVIAPKTNLKTIKIFIGNNIIT